LELGNNLTSLNGGILFGGYRFQKQDMARKRFFLKRGKRFILVAILGLILSLGVHRLPHIPAFSQAGPDSAIAQESSFSQPARSATSEAQALNREGRELLERGEAEAALTVWEKAESLYRVAGNQIGVIGSQINQAKALEFIGNFRESCDRILQAFGSDRQCEELREFHLAQVLDRLQLPNDSLNFIGLQSLGNMLRRIGKLEESQVVLRESKDKTRSPERLSLAWLNLGNTEQSLGNLWEDISNTEQAYEHYKNSLESYQNAVLFAKSLNTKLLAQINIFSLELKEKTPSELSSKEARDLLSEVKSGLDKLPPSQMTVYARINLACSLLGCDRVYGEGERKEEFLWSISEIEQLLSTAISEAEILQNPRFQSLAMGTLGTLYEYKGELRDAERLTEEAIAKAEAINAPDIEYQWEWQMGRLLKQEGDVQGAIEYYRKAVQILNYDIRHNLLSINDIEFSFQVKVEPVYRQLVDLLISTDGSSQASKKNLLKEAVEVIDSLRLSELETFNLCNFYDIEYKQELVEPEDVDDKAAFIYPIILPDRLEIIFKLPGEDWKHRASAISKIEVKDTIERLRNNLRRRSRTEEVKKDAQKVYDWLIKPIEEDLDNLRSRGELRTLVFGLDDSLQNIPMAVLYNKEEYLIENYAIAVIISRQLFESRPQQQKVNVLTAGVGQAQKDVEGIRFEELQYVPIELKEIQYVMGLTKDPLLNEAFTQDKLEQQIDSEIFPIVHIATHGQFSSDPDETFILAWNKLIKVKEFEKILQINNPYRSKAIELLVLSACETAQGNRRAALGLAGLALQARVRSTVATLWAVDDLLTSEIMVKFYEELKDGKTIAEALRQAQLFILRDRDKRTYFWAPYILVGNWQSRFGV